MDHLVPHVEVELPLPAQPKKKRMKWLGLDLLLPHHQQDANSQSTARWGNEPMMKR
jgi:hypothetical protein